MLSLPKVCLSFKKILLVILEVRMILLWLQKMVMILAESQLDICYYYLLFEFDITFLRLLIRSCPITQLINKPLKSQQSGILNCNQNLHTCKKTIYPQGFSFLIESFTYGKCTKNYTLVSSVNFQSLNVQPII